MNREKKTVYISLLLVSLMCTPVMAADTGSEQSITMNGMETSGSTIGSDISYELRQGDELSIEVEQDKELGDNKTFIITPDGYVSFPMVGRIKAAGMTIDEFTNELTNRLSTYIIDPNISVNVNRLGGVRVYVFGEINKPGAYTLTKSNTVIDAIGAAGSFNWDTAKKKIFLIHQNDPSKPIEINLNKLLKTGDMSQNYVMREGDILYLTKNSKISFSRDIAPILTGAYMVSRIGKD